MPERKSESIKKRKLLNSLIEILPKICESRIYFFSVAKEELMSLDWNKINLIIIFQDWKRFLTNIWILGNKYYVTFYCRSLPE